MRSHSPLSRILLVDSHQKPREMRAGIFRQRQIDVDSAGTFVEATEFWTTAKYALSLLTPRETPRESVDFFEMVKRENPSQSIAFLVGSPEYVTFAVPAGIVDACAVNQKE